MALITWVMMGLSSAQAAPPGPPDTFDAIAEHYFEREDQLNAAYLGLGSLQIGMGAWLLNQDHAFEQGLGGPLVAVGSIQVITGALYLALTPGFRARAEPALEDQRMQTLRPLFPLFQSVEAAAAVAGLVTWIVGSAQEDALMRGVGAGLAFSATGQLLMESAARAIASQYHEQLQTLQVGIAPLQRGALAKIGFCF